MLFPITATMELFNSFETSFSTALSTFSQQENYEKFQKGTKNCLTIGKDFRYNGIKESAIVKLRWRDVL